MVVLPRIGPRAAGESLLDAECDLQVFAGGHEEDRNPRTCSADQTVTNGAVICADVDGDAEVKQPGARATSNLGGVLTDTAGEHEGVEATE